MGGDDNVPCTCTHVGCYAGGLGRGGMITMITFLALAHMLDATQMVWGGGDDNVPCTCTHVGCYAGGLGRGGMITFLALAHMLDATQMVWGGGGDNVSRRTLSHLVNRK